MKITKIIATTFISGVSLALLAQPTAPATTSVVSAAPEAAEKPAEIDIQPEEPSQVGGGGGNFGGIGMAKPWAGAATRAAASQVSVLCFKEPDEKELGETMEDISVLGYLLSRNLEHAFAADASDYKLGIPMLLTSGNQAVGASYIQGFGALLKLQVRFPLVPPGDGAVEPETAEAGSEWEAARRELMAEDSGNDYLNSRSYMKYDAGTQPFDAKLVKTLQQHVLALLKNAANIRHLDANEWIIVKIVGTPTFSTRGKNKSKPEIELNGADADSYPKDTQPQGAPGQSANRGLANATPAKKSQKHNASRSLAVANPPASNRPTVMTLRVKKSAVDSFAAGSMSNEQFAKSADIAAYFNPALSDADLKSVAYEGARK